VRTASGPTHDHRPTVGLIALTALLVGATVLAFATAPSDRAGGRESNETSSAPQFVVECTWSHRAADDPIVHHGHAGASHEHDFFGSVETNATSTAAGLLGTASSCQMLADTAAYWVPTLYDGAEPVEPGRLFAYYRRPPGVDGREIVSYPLGLAVVAGDPGATAPQSTDVVAWHCGASPERSAVPVQCPSSAPLTLRVAFPSCWDGRSLDSADHRSHTSYPAGDGCPGRHPVALPELVLDISYRFWGPPGSLRLASGSTSTAHADFLNAWDPVRLDALVDACLRRGERCGVAPNRVDRSLLDRVEPD
jgi:hypothetical protein